MKTFEDDVRDMLHRRAEDVTPTAPPWQQLDAVDLQRSPAAAAGRTRRLVAIAAAAAVVAGIVGVQLRQDESAPPPAVDTRTTEVPPFDTETSSAVWPVGREGTPASWFRTAFEEAAGPQPPPSDDPTVVAGAYLHDRFGPKAVVLDDTGPHGDRTAVYRWRVPVDTQDATGHVYLRRVVLPQSFQRAEHTWVVVGATSDHLRVVDLRHVDNRLHFELARHEAPFATMANVHLPTGTSLVDLDRPRSFDVAADGPVTIRAQLVGGAALTLTEFRVEPPYTARPGKSLTNIRGVLQRTAGSSAAQVAEAFLREQFDVQELRMEPASEGSFDVRYESAKIGTGVVRMDRQDDKWVVVAVVGDGLSVESMAIVGDEFRRLTLSSALPGRISVVLRKGRLDDVIGTSTALLPGVDMLAGLPVNMTASPDPDTAPMAELRVEGPEGTTVAMYCLPG